MRILLYAPEFYSLHSQIIEELQKMGHTVGFIPDKIYRFDPNFKKNPLKLFKRLLAFCFNFQKDIIINHKEILKEEWDVLLCINGFSFNKDIDSIIKKINPNIRTILYLWDSLNFYDFTKNFKFFEKIITFDPEDSKNLKILYKPLFFTTKEISPNNESDIDLSFIGTQHTIRYRLLSKLKSQIINTNLKYRFYLVINNNKLSVVDYLKYLILYFCNNPSAIGFKDEYLIKKGKIVDDMITFTPLSAEEVSNIINRSKCIVDIAKPDQNGFTNRMIESLGRNKKVITNIKSIKNLTYNSTIIQYLDEDNPKIDISFLNNDVNTSDFDAYKDLRIDKWLRSILQN